MLCIRCEQLIVVSQYPALDPVRVEANAPFSAAAALCAVAASLVSRRGRGRSHVTRPLAGRAARISDAGRATTCLPRRRLRPSSHRARGLLSWPRRLCLHLRRLDEPKELVFGSERVGECPPRHERLERCGPASGAHFEVELEEVDEVVEEVRLPDRDAREGHVGEVHLRGGGP